ncbi:MULTISPECIES: glycoside hydrolase family 3 N-terminal domain-containing protein [unclassified Pseudomonas]|uniref:glycoside hydrolase family 3 N-terminal domain-containing protein n=1 Tax=unclassified Pseudomonas TaxID=196821 RepID=UPI000D373319|nr:MULTISPECIES: glycoside hydrolase family 3 N-terminal domain-containing protein [unclassified Pseudomonas]RAU42184.1 glycoside hydrolase family 3 protein [Pseudomonas sp. RIT 409]RAU49763.1 glycoside hydrolase family 3 protein [Pseudomonas sp. RIT 412]
MSSDLHRAAYAVLLPALAGLELDDTVRRCLSRGGVSVLLGETSDEYLARNMSYERRRTETHEHIARIADAAAFHAGAPVLVAVDQELGGIQRLHRLVPGLPSAEALKGLDAAEIEARSYEMASVARVMGINLFLAPLVDVVTGTHPWLHRRHLGVDPSEVSRIACAFIRGVQRAGVIATAKYFPGHCHTEHDPALALASVLGARKEMEEGLEVFRQVIAAGVQAIMPGPAVFPAQDPEHCASTSAKVISLLHARLGFDGLIVSDDLDALSILRGNSVADTAVNALRAGAHLLLVSSESGLDAIAQAIVSAVEGGELDAGRLLAAAAKVRSAAQASKAQVASGLYVSYPISGGHLTRRVMR